MRSVRLLWTFVRIGVLGELQYRTNFVVQLFQSMLGLGTALAGLSVIYAHTRSLGGWRAGQLLAVVGVYLLMGGAINLAIQPSMQRFMEDVRQGTLDFVLTKPEDAQLLISVRQIEVWKLLDIMLGIGVLVLAVSQLSTPLGLWSALGFAVALLSGGAIVYSFWIVLATLAFWVVRVDNILVIFQSMYEAGRWPVTIYPGVLRWSLTFLVPVAFAVTVPAEALSGRLSVPAVIGAIVMAVALLFGSRWFWRFGVRRYTGASA